MLRIGPRIASGGVAEVFDCGADTVAKVFHQAVGIAFARHEFENMAVAFASGLPVPRPLGLQVLDGRPVIVMRRCAGSPLLDSVLGDAGEAPSAARILARVQAVVNAADGGPLISLKQRLRRALEDLARRDCPADIAAALRRLHPLPDGSRICHGDLHPGNVMVNDRRAMVIDWCDAARGVPEADVARTLVILQFGRPGSVPDALRRSFAWRYLDQYADSVGSGLDAGQVQSWRQVCLAGRLAEPIDDRERDALLEALRTDMPAPWPGGDSA